MRHNLYAIVSSVSFMFSDAPVRFANINGPSIFTGQDVSPFVDGPFVAVLSKGRGSDVDDSISAY